MPSNASHHASDNPPAPSSPDAEPILRLRKCLIRPYIDSDAEALAIEANNPLIAQWMRNAFPHPYTLEDSKSWIALAHSNTPVHDFAICTLDNTPIGSIGLKRREDIQHRTMEIGYWLGERHWRQGIATEAVAAFSTWTFERFGHVIRLEAEVFAEHQASQGVLVKAGFEYEGRRRQAIEKAGVVRDALMYCMLRDEISS